MAPQTRGQKRQITTTKETTTTSPHTRGGGKRQTTTKATTTRGGGGGKGKSRKRQATTKATTTRGGGGGGRRTTKETTTTSNENPTIDEEEEGNIQDYEEEQLSDDESYLPARETVLAECRIEKEKLKEESKINLESLITYLKKMGMPAEQTLEEAIRQVIEGSIVNRTKRNLISKQISKYIYQRWRGTSRIFSELLQIHVWDDEVVTMVSELSKDLKDLPVRVPGIEDIASDVADVLVANERWKVRMGNELYRGVSKWLVHTMFRDETMKEWAKCPTKTIVIQKPDLQQRIYLSVFQ